MRDEGGLHECEGKREREAVNMQTVAKSCEPTKKDPPLRSFVGSAASASSKTAST